ncbi:MAG: ATP-binding protein [Lachnotalea sp.]
MKVSIRELYITNQLKKRKLFLLVLCAFLTVVLLVLLTKIFDLETGEQKGIIVKSQNSMYDLTEIHNKKGQSIILLPDEIYYPNTYLTPAPKEVAIAESVNEYRRIKAQYLSQRFVIECSKDIDIYKLTCKVSGRHAIRIYINGKMVNQSGVMGTTKNETQVWENKLTCYAAPVNQKLEVIVQVAQFYHYKKQASLVQVELESGNAITSSLITEQEKGWLVMGALLCAASFLFSIHLIQPIAKETLYFAIACVVMTMRECLQSQTWTYFTWIPGNVSFMLEYLSVVLLTIFLSLYLGQYASKPYLKKIQIVAIVSSVLYGVCVLFGDSLFYTSILLYYQAILVVCIVLGIGGVFWNSRSPLQEQVAALYGIAVFCMAAVRDILMYNNVFGDSVKEPITEESMLIFVLAQTISLFLINNRLIAQAREAEHRQLVENEGLEKINQMKTEFLGNVSHELKTPLMVVSGYAQNVIRMAEGAQQPDAENIIHKMKLITSETERLSILVRQLLDVTRMEEGRMVIDKTPCYVDEIIYEAVETHFPILNKNDNKLEIRIEGNIPIIQADHGRILQIIVNLIANASRYTRKGNIIVSAVQEDNNVVIRVKDTGQGISSERLLEIFERYSNKVSENGSVVETGLGLPICKYIVEEHGGSIQVESKEEEGTTVSFTLPI